jgi:hypothetical protein
MQLPHADELSEMVETLLRQRAEQGRHPSRFECKVMANALGIARRERARQSDLADIHARSHGELSEMLGVPPTTSAAELCEMIEDARSPIDLMVACDAILPALAAQLDVDQPSYRSRPTGGASGIVSESDDPSD